jgi:hypothetical protein
MNSGAGDGMARPQKEGLEYFPHDVYASSDEKLEPLILLYGAKGYAFFFLHLEYIYRTKDLEFDISDAETREVIMQKLHISANEYEQILQTALKKKCFDRSYFEVTHKLTSDGIKKRASSVIEKRDRMRLAYEQKVSAAETTHIKESKVKESKVKYIKDLIIFSPESWEYKLAAALKQLILINNPTAKTPDDLQNWAKGFDMILRVDKRKLDELTEVLRYSQQDIFWMKNVLSPTSFRKYYDKLKMLWEEWQAKINA